MLHTTFKLAHESGACTEGYRKLAKHLGGVDKYGKDTPIPLSKIVESNGLLDAIWTLRCTLEPSENIQIEFACRCAEHVLHFYEDKYPDDNRPRKAIETTRACITDKSQAAREAAWAAALAARDAAGAAAWAARAAGDAALAARDAAGAARDAALDALAAEREWQTKTFLELLNQ